MSCQQSFSRFRKKAKGKMLNIRDRMKRYGTDVRGEGLNHSTLSVQSEPAIVVEGVGNEDPRPDDCPPVSRSMAELEREPGRRRTPTPSILQDPESESTWAAPFQSPPLTDDAANPAVLGAAASKDESEWKRTVSSAAKLALRTVREASDAFPPLRSVAGGLCAILDNCEVRSSIVRSIRDAYSIHSKRRSTNKL